MRRRRKGMGQECRGVSVRALQNAVSSTSGRSAGRECCGQRQGFGVRIDVAAKGNQISSGVTYMPFDTHPEAASIQQEIIRRMTTAQRLRLALEMSESM